MFELSLQPVLKWEGGYVNDLDDPGGATNKGVTQKVYDSWRRSKKLESQSVKFITNLEAEDIYYNRYWLAGKCHRLPDGVALIHFDFCVNAGIRQAARTLQRVVETTPDGIIGPKTLAAVAKFNPEDLIHDYSEARRNFYRSLAAKRPRLSKFLRGWINRTNDIERRALKIIGRGNPSS